MNRTQRIEQSKKDIKQSESINITPELLKMYDEFDSRKDDKDFLQMILIRIVSSNESFFKETIASILDYKEEYAKNCKSLLKKKGIKLDIDDLIQVTKRTFSIGDLISYSLTYSSIETILSNYEEITKIDVYKELDTVNELKDKELLEYYEIDIENYYNKNRIISNLKEVYKLRNSIAHDFLLATHKLVLDSNKIKEYLLDTCLLQIFIDDISNRLIYTDVPIEHEERVNYYNQIAISKEQELNSLYSEIESTFSSQEQKDNFLKTKLLFQKFLDNDSENFGSWFWSDGIFPELVTEKRIELLDQRIEMIKEDRKRSS